MFYRLDNITDCGISTSIVSGKSVSLSDCNQFQTVLTHIAPLKVRPFNSAVRQQSAVEGVSGGGAERRPKAEDRRQPLFALRSRSQWRNLILA